MEAALLDPNGGRRWVIYDEAWRLMSYPALLRRMDAHWRLARHYGLANLLVFHKLTDLENVGDAGSTNRALANSLLANAATRIVYRQETDQLGPTTAALGLTGIGTTPYVVISGTVQLGSDTDATADYRHAAGTTHRYRRPRRSFQLAIRRTRPDGDGLSLVIEIADGSDPCEPDSDGDGLNDHDEATVHNTSLSVPRREEGQRASTSTWTTTNSASG